MGEHRDDAGGTPRQVPPPLFSRLPLSERSWVIRALRDETVGGILLVVAAVAALVLANTGASQWYTDLATTEIGVGHFTLTVQQWAADGLLAVFFFVAGLELKHELVLGSLSKVSRAIVPVAAALGGMVVPALIYTGVNLASDAGEPIGWGIPMATDIAFALAVLAIVGRGLPVALRAFLLTLAVVDDLGAIIVIAIFYSGGFSPLWFGVSLVALGAYAWLQHRRVRTGWLLLPLAVFAWAAVHESGVHATIAGVALGLLTRVRPDPGEREDDTPASRLEHVVRPISAGVCVPLFAFFSAGVVLAGEGLSTALSSPVAIGVMLGLVVGKPVGVLAGAWLSARFTRASLSSSLGWLDVLAIGVIAGIGFTVSLLIAELAFDEDAATLTSAKTAILAASVIAALLAAITLRARTRHYAALAAIDERDDDGDGIPDVYQQDTQ